MKYMKAFIRIEILAAILWMSASPCMAQQNLRSKRAVSKSTVLPSIGRLSDKLSIMEDVKTRFAKWCQKGEFEKLAAVDGRLRTQSKEVLIESVKRQSLDKLVSMVKLQWAPIAPFPLMILRKRLLECILQ